MAGLIGRGLVRPLLSVAGPRTAAGRRPVGPGDPADPAEVRRIADALNGLADRIKDLLQPEREAAADLSHRLRTPLTALRLDAEGLRDPEEAERMLASVAGVERMVSHVIAQARRPARETGAMGDAAAVVRDRVSSGRRWRRSRNGRYGRSCRTGRCPCRSPRTTWPPRWTRCSGTSSRTRRSGPASPWPYGQGRCRRWWWRTPVPGSRTRRCWAAAGPRGSSTGLGLDIVRRTAEEAGGRLDLSAAQPSGLRAVVWLGPPPP